MAQMDKKNIENSKLLQECYHLTRLIQEHNSGKKTIGRALPRQGVNLYSSSTVSKYQKINTNKTNGSNLKMPISSNVLLKNKTSMHKTWINSHVSSSKPAVSRDLKVSAPKSELPNTQKHCMYFNPNFLKTNISELDMTGQRLPKPKTNQNKTNLIHINPKALIHMVYSDLQKEENSNLSSERLITVDNNISKKHVPPPSLTSEGKMPIRSNSNLGKDVMVDVNSFEKHKPSHLNNTDVREVTGRSYSFCSDKKLVRNPLKHQFRVTSNTSMHRRNLQHPVNLINTSPAHSRSLRSWECKAFKARCSVDLKATTSSPANAFKFLGKRMRRNSLSVSRRRTSSSSSTSTVVKAAKLVCSKYKITRTTYKKRHSPNLRFSADSQTDKNIKRLKKVKTYSLKYESAVSRKNITFSQAHQKKICTSDTYRNQISSKRPFSTRGEKNRKVRIRGSEQQRCKNGMHSISHLSLVRIGGVLYRSSKLKLARSITPKEKTGARKTPRQSQTKSGSNVHRCIVHVRGNAFLMDSTGKTLQRIKNNSSKPNVDIKKPSPLKRVDIGGVTYIQKSANVLIRTNTHKARSLLSQAKQRSIAMLTSKMRKSNQTCIFYHRFGKCSKLEKGICPHIHDPKQIAVCRKFLQGICDLKNCKLSHEVGPEKMPTCRYFLEGCCVKDSCPYLHVKVNPKAEICKNFLQGYCPEGQKCRKRHSYICPDFENGKCSNGKYCPYPHKNVVVGKNKIKKKTPINKINLITKEKMAQKRYYQEEEQKDSLKLEETNLEVKAQEDLEEHKTDLEVKRIKILQKVDLMKKSWQNSPAGKPVENMDSQNMEVSSQFSSDTVVERPKLGTLPAFIPIG